MTKKMKRNLIEYGVLATVLLTLFFTGLHTEVFGFLQRGMLATGIMNPDVNEKTDAVVTEDYPKADFRLNLVDSKGEKVSMEQFKGQVIFVNVWATWCPPCIAEMPGINKLFNDVKDDNVVFLMLSVDQNFEKAKRFSGKKGFAFEVYSLDGAIPEMYYTESIPTTFVIDANGALALRHEGMANYNTTEFRRFLRSLK